MIGICSLNNHFAQFFFGIGFLIDWPLFFSSSMMTNIYVTLVIYLLCNLK